MPSPLEAEISSLLIVQKDRAVVAEELVSRWRKNLFSEAEQIDCAQFLVAAGLHATLFGEVQRLIRERAKVPWAQFSEALGKIGVTMTATELTAIHQCALEQDALNDLLRSHVLDELDPAFALKRLEFATTRMNETNEKKQALRDRLQYMRSHRMLDQELQVLNEFQALFPGEPEVLQAKEGFDLRWAREAVANAGTSNDRAIDDRSVKLLEWKVDRLTPEQLDAKEMIIERAVNLIRDHQSAQLAYDLAIGFQLMDFHSEALEILASIGTAPDLTPHLQAAIDWLRLELMLKARQFATALEEASRLELDYATEPDSSFSVTYARARALHGLGQTQMAVDLLQTLVRLRPNYKSAQSLLEDWSGGEA